MPEKTEFEEKEYEQPLNHQLLKSSNNLWSPGQVFEKIFGIDAAILATDISFWKLFGYSATPSGIDLNSYRWWYLWRLVNKTVKKFPSFKVNVLIQAKRPSYRFGVDSSYSKNGIKNDYWFFKVTHHQQVILEKLEEKLSNDALVVYACASFHKFSDLDKYISNGEIVKNSTFVKPLKLKNHSRWVYDRPGTTGLANPKIEKHEDDSFEIQLGRLLNLEGNQLELNQSDALKNLLLLEKTAIEICESTENNPIADAFIRRRGEMLSSLKDINLTNNEAIRAFSSFTIFTHTLNISWWTI